MSYFPDFLQLQRSASNNWAEKSDCQMPRATMNELIMNYLVTGKAVEINFSSKLKYQHNVKNVICFFNFL